MEQLGLLFKQLGDIIVRAIPAFVVFLLLHLYLKKVLFQPLERILEERRSKTQGSFNASEALVRAAAEKLDGYEKTISEARADIYKEQEAARRKLAAAEAESLNRARSEFSAKVASARASIEAEADQARISLASEAERLADSIANSVLAGRN